MNVEIKLDRQTSYHPGDFIKARVSLSGKNETTIQRAQITLICEEKFPVEKPINPLWVLLIFFLGGGGEGGTDRSEATYRREIVKQVFLEDRMFPPDFNQYFDLKLEIPPDALQSVNGRDIKVKWWVEVRLNPKKGSTIVATSNLLVTCTLPEARSSQVINPSEFDTTCPPEKMEVSFVIPRSVWVCGETIEGQLSVIGHEDFDFTEIRVQIKQAGVWFESTIVPNNEVVSYVNLAGNTTLTAEKNLVIPFKIAIPRGMLPTMKSRNIKIAWQLKGILACTPTEEYEIVLPIQVFSEN